MKELEETNCEVRNILNFTPPLWNQSGDWGSQEEPMTTDGSKESSQNQTLGGFLSNDCKYAWLSCGTRLVVIDVRYGECISQWNFLYKITSVSPFPSEPGKVPLLLVGLDNNAIRIKDSIGHLCIFNCCSMTILATIEVPAGVEKACVIHGGEEWEEFNEKRPDTVLSGNSGLIFVALRNLQHVIIDINRSLWAESLYNGKNIVAKLEFVNPLNPKTTTSKCNKESTHLAYDLMDKEIEQYMGFDRNDFESTPLYDESLCSILLSSMKIGCLITGCLGRIIIWQNDGSIGWISPPFDENAYVTHVALLEPSDDPRPFYYLWIACQNDSPESSAVLRMYAMLFNKKCNDKTDESSLYFNLESEPSLKFELELEQGERVHSLLSVERENSYDSADCTIRHGEDSLLLIGTSERLLMFDLNRWYKEQMPRTMAECRNPNSVMASYRTKQEDDDKQGIIACSFIPKSLREFPKGPSSPEELFYPNSLTLEWVELGLGNLTFWLARGVQTELLREITIAGPIVLIKPTETYRRCLTAGLVPFDSLPQDFALDADKIQQREMLLCLCLEQRWSNFLSRCANEWSDGSAAYLYPEFIRWGVQRASELKLCADSLCVPLFDQSGVNIGDAEVKTLRFCCQQLECLASVISKLPNLESDLEKQRRALKRIATYLQVLLWFYDVGLLPENQINEEEEDVPQITLLTKIPYPRDKLIELYRKKRGSRTNGEEKEKEKLFIDQLIYHNCLPLTAQWKKEADCEILDHGGYYPPPSLQSLLRSFLVDCYRNDADVTAATASALDDDIDEFDQAEMENKHSITIYLLMDIAMLLQSTYPSVDRLIKYPSAFKLSPSLIKITQAFWSLDHDDYDEFFKIVTGQLIHSNDIKNWHHRLAIDALLKNDQHKLALAYLRILKPPLASLDDQGTIITLSVEHGLVESAFHARPPSHYAQLLTKFFQACKANGKLADILQLSLDTEEEEAFVKFLKENGCEDTRLLYYLQRCRHTEAGDLFNLDRLLNSHHSTSTKIHPSTLKVLSAFNATLPDITRHFATNFTKSSASNLSLNKPIQPLQHQLSFLDSSSAMTNTGTGRCYPRPMSQCRDKMRGIYEIAVSKTRETCLKADRPNSSLTHVPFLDAPCSTIVFCSRTSGNLTESTDVHNVLYPEKKMIRGKRKHTAMVEEEENIDSNIDNKRRRLAGGADINVFNGDNETQLTRRLSMSNVCETPLIQRKLRSDARDSNGLNTETPHSILKIRELLRRNSNSPGYGFKMNSTNEREELLTHSISGNGRPPRQIRFSMDRMSGNSNTSVNVSKAEDLETDSNCSNGSKNIEEESCAEEAFYSPNVSNKSLRNSSILSDSSITKFNLWGPRPRPSLRRASMLSRTSSDYQSQMNSSTSTSLDASEMTTSNEENKKTSNVSFISPRKSMLNSPTLYNASILDSDTSIENSSFKKPLFPYNNERNDDEKTDESDNESEDSQEVIAELHDTGLDKDTSIEPSRKEPSEEEEEDEGIIEEEIDEEEEKVSLNEDSNYDEVKTQREDEKDNFNVSTHSMQRNLPQENEISEDEEEREFDPEFQKVLDDEEEDEAEFDDVFESLNNTIDNEATSEITTNCIRELEKNIDHGTRFNYASTTPQSIALNKYQCDQNYSLTKNILLNKPDNSTFNYSLTKPIFLDSCGIARLQDSIVITDDESNDATHIEPKDLEPVNLPYSVAEEEEQDEDEDAELTLNLSGSDGSENAKNLKIKELPEEGMLKNKRKEMIKEELRVEKEMRLFTSELSDSSSESGLTKKEETTPKKNEGSRSRTSSKSEDVDGEGTPLRRSSRQHLATRQVPSPRRSIKSMSVSPRSKPNETALSNKSVLVDRTKRSTSISKEMKKNLSNVIANTSPSKQIEEEQEFENSKKSPTSKSVGRKTRTASRTSSRESSQETALEKNSPSVPEDSAISTELLEQKSTKTRTTRAGSVTKDSVMKTRATSILKENKTIEVNSEEDFIDIPKQKRGRGRPPKISKDITVSPTPKKDLGKEKAAEIQEIVKVANSKDSTVIKPAVTRKTRAGSVAEETIITQEDKPTRKTRAGSVAIDEEDKPIRRTRTVSVTVDEKDKPTRKTRAGSVTVDEEDKPGRKTRSGSVAVDEEDKPGRKTRSGSVAVDEEDKPGRKTRSGSVAIDEENKLTRQSRSGSASVDEDDKPTRKTRAGSMAKDEESKFTRKTRAGSVTVDEDKPTRKTRAGSIVADDEITKEKLVRKTRGTSVSKEEKTSRKTRASSLAKDASSEEVSDSILSKRSTRKRGNSVPKEATPVVELVRVTSHGRRSTSLLKDVILEESLSQLDSPAGNKRSKLPRAIDETAASSPASNTRSRRSSIQSVPEEIEEFLSSKKTSDIKDDTRTRRAASVDSTAVSTIGTRLTRSTRTKISILEDIIPEESVLKSPQTKKHLTRRKRATSLSVEAIEEAEKEKAKFKPKRGRNASQSKDKDFLFSPPKEAGEISESGEEGCRTPTFKFSEPTGLQKFLTSIPNDDDEESSDATVNVLQHNLQLDRERMTSTRILRRPRTCFVLPKRNKKK